MSCMKQLIKIFSVIFLFSYSFNSTAEVYQIDMLNKLDKEKMVYSKKIISVNIDDTIIWKSISKGHNVEFISMPKGVKKFKSKINKDAEYNFKIPGIYFYQCTPHKAMGMIGLVIVGNDKHNIENVKKTKIYGKSKKIFKKLLKEIE